ncbi:MAG: RNA polymerase subunit sigma-70 [Oscillospiraceae bacterium]|nr:RNA polymerase subunit sigma-70 [Oscillospiraceae bacterium]
MTDTQKQKIARLRGEGKSSPAIAAALDISVNTVKSYCRRKGLGEVKAQTRLCAHCGAELAGPAKTKPKKFCSDRCRAAWWGAHPEKLRPGKVHAVDCAHCGAAFHSSVSANRKYCSHECYITQRFKGGGAA